MSNSDRYMYRRVSHVEGGIASLARLSIDDFMQVSDHRAPTVVLLESPLFQAMWDGRCSALPAERYSLVEDGVCEIRDGVRP